MSRYNPNNNLRHWFQGNQNTPYQEQPQTHYDPQQPAQGSQQASSSWLLPEQQTFQQYDPHQDFPQQDIQLPLPDLPPPVPGLQPSLPSFQPHQYLQPQQPSSQLYGFSPAPWALTSPTIVPTPYTVLAAMPGPQPASLRRSLQQDLNDDFWRLPRGDFDDPLPLPSRLSLFSPPSAPIPQLPYGEPGPSRHRPSPPPRPAAPASTWMEASQLGAPLQDAPPASTIQRGSRPNRRMRPRPTPYPAAASSSSTHDALVPLDQPDEESRKKRCKEECRIKASHWSRHWTNSCPHNPDGKITRCPRCDAPFHRPDNLKRHLEKVCGKEKSRKGRKR